MFRHPSHIIITVLNSILPGNIRRPFFLAIHLIREISVDCDDVPIVDRFARYPYTMLKLLPISKSNHLSECVSSLESVFMRSLVLYYF